MPLMRDLAAVLRVLKVPTGSHPHYALLVDPGCFRTQVEVPPAIYAALVNTQEFLALVLVPLVNLVSTL